MATARIESWPGGPEGRAYTADGDVNMPPGWEPPAPEHRERIARLIKERVTEHEARERAEGNQRHVREQVERHDPELARVVEAFFGDRTEREPRQQRGRARR